MLGTRQPTVNHKLHRRIHVNGNDGFIGVERRPDSQQFIHKPLADVGDPGKVYLYGVKVAFQAIQQPSCFAS